jgi:hypothetical protein
MSQLTEKTAFVRKERKGRKEERTEMTGSANAASSSRPSAIFASFASFAFFADKKAVNMTATPFDARINAPPRASSDYSPPHQRPPSKGRNLAQARHGSRVVGWPDGDSKEKGLRGYPCKPLI